MKQRPRIHYTQSQRALMWERWQKGESLTDRIRIGCMRTRHVSVNRLFRFGYHFRELTDAHIVESLELRVEQ